MKVDFARLDKQYAVIIASFRQMLAWERRVQS